LTTATIKRIYRGDDDHGPVEVYDDGQRRYLSFADDDEQSCTLKAAPALPQLDYIRAMVLPLLYGRPSDAVLLGLGAGSLASCLHRHYRSLQLRAVELRPLVIEVAHRYFDLPRSERLQVIAADADRYLRRPGLATTDLLLCDLYHADDMDPCCLTAGFIAACAQLLSERGWLVINCWEEHREDDELLTLVASHFAEIHVCTVATGNWLLFASRRRQRLSRNQLLARVETLSRRLGFEIGPYFDQLHRIYAGPVA
jgi:spermidine synthase